MLPALLLIGCAGDLDQPDRFDRDGAIAGDGDGDGVPQCVTEILQDNCGTAACHGDGALQVDLLSDGVEGRVVDADAKAGGVCDGEVLVSTDGGTSLLLDKLMDSPVCGERMPYLASPLSQGDIDCIGAWVESLGGTVTP